MTRRSKSKKVSTVNLFTDTPFSFQQQAVLFIGLMVIFWYAALA